MKRIINLPNSEKINQDVIEQIYKRNFPEYNVYSKDNYIYVKKNLFVTLRTHIESYGDSCKRMFYGTKMNFLHLICILFPIVIAVICLIMMQTDSVVNAVDIESINNAYKKSQLYGILILLCLIVSIVIYVIYPIMRGTLLNDVHFVLYKELPERCEDNERSFFFPRLDDVRKWHSSMGVVKWLFVSLVAINILNANFHIICYYLQLPISPETIYFSIIPILNALYTLTLLIIAIFFMRKSYNKFFHVAKYAFLCYAVLSLISFVLFSTHVNEDLRTIDRIFNYVYKILFIIFSVYMYKAFRNGATLYLVKNYIIYLFFYILGVILFICTSDIQSVIATMVRTLSVLCFMYYSIFMVKSVIGLYEQVPQGIKIKY